MTAGTNLVEAEKCGPHSGGGGMVCAPLFIADHLLQLTAFECLSVNAADSGKGGCV